LGRIVRTSNGLNLIDVAGFVWKVFGLLASRTIAGFAPTS